MNHELTITLYQQDIVWGDAKKNRQMAEDYFSRSPKSDIIMVPETFTTGFGEHMAAEAEPEKGATLQWAKEMARKHDAMFVGTWIISKQAAADSERHKIFYNRMHLVKPDGTYDTYDKGHTFRQSSEATQIERGRKPVIAEWRGWRIKPCICYDLRFPKWLRNGGKTEEMNYDLMLVCANWPGSRHEAWSTLLRARAIENLCYVAGCNREGIDGTGILYKGCSAIVDYKGFDRPTLTETLSKEALHNFRKHWDFYLDFD